MVLGILTGLLRRSGSHTPLGNFSSKWATRTFTRDAKEIRNSGRNGGFILRSLLNYRMPDMTGFRLKRTYGPRRARETRRARDAR